MARTIGLGIQDFRKVMENHYFYIDKSMLIKEWWESGFGRYDIMLAPKKAQMDAYLIEFKVFNPKKEDSLTDTVNTALAQINQKNYTDELLKMGVSSDRIYKYGFAFEGKNVRIGD